MRARPRVTQLAEPQSQALTQQDSLTSGKWCLLLARRRLAVRVLPVFGCSRASGFFTTCGFVSLTTWALCGLTPSPQLRPGGLGWAWDPGGESDFRDEGSWGNPREEVPVRTPV